MAPIRIDYQTPAVRPPPKKNRKLFAASMIVFAASLAFPGYYVAGGSSSWSPGFACLLCGCLGDTPAWFANPFLFATWFCLRRESALRITPIVLALASLSFALAFLFQRQVPLDEAGHMDTITGHGIGYWLWLTSIVAALIASIVGLSDE